jgi:hypothetical protein
MANRIDIQLTARVADDHWSWHAAGAREPRGIVSSALVPDGSKEGDVLRAEIERSIEGIEITALNASTEPNQKPARAATIELLGSGRQQTGVSWSLAPKAKRGGTRREGDRPSRGRDAERGGPRGADRRERSGSGGPPSRGGPGGGSRGDRPGGPRPEGRGRPQVPAQSTDHRNALLATLDSAQLTIAEQLLRGGIPAVRQAIEEQNAQAKAEGRPPASEEAIMGIAEGLLPLTTLAAWKDRAHTAQAGGKDTRLRDLRAIVAASRSVSLDEEGRAMAKALHETLDHRVKALSDEWVARITTALDESRIVDALKLASRSPEHSTRCPADVATRLAEVAGTAMTADTDPREWMALLDAVVDSPMRRIVKPQGIPPEADVEVAARNAAGLVPALAALLGLRIPPPPPRRVVHRP